MKFIISSLAFLRQTHLKITIFDKYAISKIKSHNKQNFSSTIKMIKAKIFVISEGLCLVFTKQTEKESMPKLDTFFKGECTML
jgi:hypothetical protein